MEGGGEEEEEVTIDDGDGDGGEEVLLAMGNAINRWGREKGSRGSRGAGAATMAQATAPADATHKPLPSSVMARMGLLPHSMLQRMLLQPAPVV